MSVPRVNSIKNIWMRRAVILVWLPVSVVLLAAIGALIGAIEVFDGFWSDVKFSWVSRW